MESLETVTLYIVSPNYIFVIGISNNIYNGILVKFYNNNSTFTNFSINKEIEKQKYRNDRQNEKISKYIQIFPSLLINTSKHFILIKIKGGKKIISINSDIEYKLIYIYNKIPDYNINKYYIKINNIIIDSDKEINNASN